MVEIYFDVLTRKQVDSAGGQAAACPRIAYESYPTWRIRFVTADPAAGTVTPVDVSAGITWRAAIDKDYDSTTEPMCRTLNADIDSSDAANGIIDVLLDAFTPPFLAALAGQGKLRECPFELAGYDALGKKIHDAIILVEATGSVDPAGGDPIDPPGNFYTKTEDDAHDLRKIAGTQVTLTDNATTNFTIGAVADIAASQVLGVVTDGTNYETWDVLVAHDGTNASVALRRTVQGTELNHAKITVAASISGGNLRLAVTLAAYGQNLTAVFKPSSVSALT